jgi:hypothetical protein
MFRSTRMRAFAVSMLALGAYAAVYGGALDRRLQGNGMLFFAVVATVVLISGWYFAPRRLTVWITWGALTPPLASAVAYAAIIAGFYARHETVDPDMSAGSWMLIAFGFPYFVCGVWLLSVVLPALGAMSHFLLPAATKNEASN